MLQLYKLKNSKHKYKIEFPEGGRSIYFGAAGYDDYTIHHDKARKLRYIARHEKRENWSSQYTAGFYSRWLLWEKKTLKSAIRNMYKKFGIKINLN